MCTRVPFFSTRGLKTLISLLTAEVIEADVCIIDAQRVEQVAVGFIFGVVQDSVETALNSSGDVFFTATAEEFDRKKKG